MILNNPATAGFAETGPFLQVDLDRIYQWGVGCQQSG
jgi:hypothetical protein